MAAPHINAHGNQVRTVALVDYYTGDPVGSSGTTGGINPAVPPITYPIYPVSAVKTDAGTIMAGALSITAFNKSGVDAVFQGVTLPVGASVTFDSPPQSALVAIPYSAIGANLQIVATSYLSSFII